MVKYASQIIQIDCFDWSFIWQLAHVHYRDGAGSWYIQELICMYILWIMDVSKNNGTPKWMVCNGINLNLIKNGQFDDTTIFGNIHSIYKIKSPES